MEHTTLPTKPGRYLDRDGDEWTLNENSEWECSGVNYGGGSYSSARQWLPFTDAPEDDKTQRIDSVDDLEPGDLVYFHDDARGYRFMNFVSGNYLRVSLHEGGMPRWLCDALSDYVMVYVEYFDHATREAEEPEWPDPHDLKLHVYLGSDGRRYIYNPCSEQDTCPWTVENSTGFYSRQRIAHIFQGALHLTELKLVPKEEES